VNWLVSSGSSDGFWFFNCVVQQRQECLKVAGQRVLSTPGRAGRRGAGGVVHGGCDRRDGGGNGAGGHVLSSDANVDAAARPAACGHSRLAACRRERGWNPARRAVLFSANRCWRSRPAEAPGRAGRLETAFSDVLSPRPCWKCALEVARVPPQRVERFHALDGRDGEVTLPLVSDVEPALRCGRGPADRGGSRTGCVRQSAAPRISTRRGRLSGNRCGIRGRLWMAPSVPFVPAAASRSFRRQRRPARVSSRPAARCRSRRSLTDAPGT